MYGWVVLGFNSMFAKQNGKGVLGFATRKNERTKQSKCKYIICCQAGDA